MTYIPRTLQKNLSEATAKAVVVTGARGTGKTALLRKITSGKTVWFRGDVPSEAGRLAALSADDMRALLSSADTVVIDEARYVPSISGLIEQMVAVNTTLEKPAGLFVTTSASPDFTADAQDTAARLVSFRLWPLSVTELAQRDGGSRAKVLRDLPWHLVYGMLPEVCAEPRNAGKYLTSFTAVPLFQDLFAFAGIRHPAGLVRLARELAFLVGTEVNYENLSRVTGLNKLTVAAYVDLMEKYGIVKICPSYAGRLPHELKKGKKIYFCDVGIRNALIGNFEPFSTRRDTAALWENFFFMERIKLHSYGGDGGCVYFWRASKKKSNHIDFVEIEGAQMQAFNCRCSPMDSVKPVPDFLEAYPYCPVRTVSPATFLKLWHESNDCHNSLKLQEPPVASAVEA